MTTEAGAVTFLFHPQYMQMAVQQSLSVELFSRGAQGHRDDRINVGMLMGNEQFSDIRVVTIS